MDKVETSEKVLVGCDFNDHVGSDMGGFGEVHEAFVIEQINDEIIMIKEKVSL